MLMARSKNVHIIYHIMVDVIHLQKKKVNPRKNSCKNKQTQKSRAKDGISWAG